MAAARLDLEIEQGSTFVKKLEFSNLTIPTDLTGHSFKAQIRPTPYGVLLANFTVTMADQSTNPGVIYLKLTSAETMGLNLKASPYGELNPTKYVYDLKQTFPDGTTERAIQGNVLVTPGVTN